MSQNIIKQHLIDPEICIRCYTCEETCQLNAISHDDNNVVVDASKCNSCMDCIAPCPTGSIDNWRFVNSDIAYSVEEQLNWDDLPEQDEKLQSEEGAATEALEDEITALIEQAHAGAGGVSLAPESAEQASINLYTRSRPVIAQVQGNVRVTADDTQSDVRHIILNLSATHFPILEGQTIGIAPPGNGEKKNAIRLYSVSSARDGEKRNANNLAITVKREADGLCSNYLCDLVKGDEVEISGPFGSTFLMPNDPAANILMLCTGTGSAPFRAFTERRRRAAPGASGKMIMYYGGQSPEALPYFEQLKRVPDWLVQQHLVYSRLPGQPKEYIQDRIKSHDKSIAGLLDQPQTHIYICGVKGMETGVEDAFQAICQDNEIDWSELKQIMQQTGRYHVETY